MPIDSSFLPPADDQAHPVLIQPPEPSYSGAPASPTPHLGHTLLFGVLVLLVSIAMGVVFAVSLSHIKPYVHETSEQMQTDPRIVIPVEAIVYGLAAAATILILPLLWGRSFAQGVHWRAVAVKRRWWVLVGIGVVTSITVQLLSNFLPIPKELPIDKFFTNRVGVWLVAIFGVTVAPAFEELAFRGFLLPSLASAWDWVVQRRHTRAHDRMIEQATLADWQADAAFHSSAPIERESIINRLSAERRETETGPGLDQPDPRWSLPALIFSTVITSIGFALLHSDQLAHSFAPLSVLFVVSLVLCFTRLRFQSLAASTLVHSMYNATIFVMLFLGTDGFRHLDKLGK